MKSELRTTLRPFVLLGVVGLTMGAPVTFSVMKGRDLSSVNNFSKCTKFPPFVSGRHPDVNPDPVQSTKREQAISEYYLSDRAVDARVEIMTEEFLVSEKVGCRVACSFYLGEINKKPVPCVNGSTTWQRMHVFQYG